MGACLVSAFQLNVVWSFVSYALEAFVTNTDYRNGVLTAVMIGAVVFAVQRVLRTLGNRIRAIKARRKEPKVVVEEPSMFKGAAKNARRAMGLAVFVAILIFLF